MVYPGFIGPAYRSQSIAAAGDQLINLYPEILESKGASQAVFYGTPGLRRFLTFPTFPVRGSTSLPGASSDYCYAVAGDTLYRVNGANDYTSLGTGLPRALPGGTSPVSMQTNGEQVAIAIAGQLWVYANGTLAQIDPDVVPGAGLVSYCDGYFIVNVPGTNKFFISGLFDATSWAALDFGGKTGFPDLIVGQTCDHRELWLFGSRTTEIFWNSGNPNFPWERLQGPFIQSGLAAPMSLSRIDNTHFWLGQDERGSRMFWRADGYTPKRISTFAIEYALSTYERVDDAIAYSYQEKGHTDYVVSFPTVTSGLNASSATWVYDASNELWHQRDYLDPQFALSQRVRGQNHCFAFGLHLVGDWENGNLYEQSTNIYTDDISNESQVRIRRLRRAPHLIKEHQRIFYPGLELHIQQGVVPQDLQPSFSLRKSNDGGFTWSNYLTAQAGLVGEYRKRLLWRRLGNSRDTVFEVSSDDPMEHCWIGAYFNPDPEVSPN